MEEQPQLTPQEQTAELAIALINQNAAFAEAAANKVIADAETVPERVLGLVLRKAEEKGIPDTPLLRFRLGQPVEIKENLLLDILWATTWVGWVVRAALYGAFVVLVATFLKANFLPQPVQSVQFQQVQENQ
jgi:hypothetical protein